MDRRLHVAVVVSHLAFGLGFGCGTESDGGTDRGTSSALLSVRGANAATLARLKGFQISVSTEPVPVVCAQVQRSCFKGSLFYARQNLIPIQGSNGIPREALFIPAALDAHSEQPLRIGGLPPGQDDAVVVEALTQDAPPQFLGGLCGIQSTVTTGPNTATFNPVLTLLATPVPCDPTLP